VPPRDRARRERLCRHALRPPIATDQLHLTADGHVVLELRHRWADGTTQLLFEPGELLERVAALPPRPRINLLLYYGVLGARSAWRSRVQVPDPETPVSPLGSPRPQTGDSAHHDAIGNGVSVASVFRRSVDRRLKRRMIRAVHGGNPRCAGVGPGPHNGIPSTSRAETAANRSYRLVRSAI
jgi:hypothetical protein